MKLSLLIVFLLNISQNYCLDELQISHLIDNLNENDILDLNPEQIENDYRSLVKSHFNSIDPEAFMNASEIIKYHGYPVEVHTVVTNDGYILKIQRIPHGKVEFNSSKPRKPVLIQHGLFCSSVVWVTNTPDKNLPYILADAGYDVWLGNIRGTVYGYNNTKFSPQDKEFWEYSFDQMAKYDLPAVIQTILNVSNSQQLHYIGHSLGTTMLFALLSSQPEYNDIIKAGFTLAPVTLPHNIRGGFQIIKNIFPEIKWIYNLLGIGKFYLPPKITQFFARTLCDSPLKVICENVMFLLCGYDYSQTNATRLPVHLYHTPDATSLQNVLHLEQMMEPESKFQYYDYGSKGNIKHYNQTTPPLYNMSQVTAPIAIFWADNDYLADPIDVLSLVSQLNNSPLVYKVPNENFNHLDFMWAIDVKPLLYNKLLNVMQKLWKE